MSPRNYWNLRFQQQGLSLVEILVGMTVGLMLTAGVVQIFVGSKQGYRIQTALSRLQENGRFAINFISHDIRNAGFFGCAGNTTRLVSTLNNANQYVWNFSTVLQGFEATGSDTWVPALDTSIITQPLSSRDVITLRHVSGDPAAVEPPFMPDTSAALHINTGNGLSQGDIVMVSDCIDSAIFQITNANPDTSGSLVHSDNSSSDEDDEDDGSITPGNATKDLGKKYTDKAAIIQVKTTTYYIRTDAEGRPSLYRKDGADDPQELIEGVEDMQILYGEVIDDGHRYSAADKVTNWDNVISVRISLLLRSLEDNLASSPQSYTFNEVTATPSDRRLRRVFTATVNLRNRAL